MKNDTTIISLGSLAELKAYAGSPAVQSAPLVVDQATIDTFAKVTRDEQWIHVDPKRAAAESPFGGTIAHGLLTLSLIPTLYQGLFAFPNRKFALNYGFDKVRFTSPVKVGSALVGHFVLAKVEEVGENEVRCFWTVELRVGEATRPALVANWLVQMKY